MIHDPRHLADAGATHRPHAVIARSRQLCRGGIAVSLLASSSCGRPSEPPSGLTLCAVPLTVTVLGGETPTYRWAPRCGATYLEVTTENRQQVFWVVQGDTGKFGPGVRHGVAPPAFTSRLGPLPLARGGTYLVRVGIMVDENSFFTFGEGAFVY